MKTTALVPARLTRLASLSLQTATLLKVASVLTLLSLTIFYLLLARHYSLQLFDEGLAAYGGWRVSRGGVPGADFWSQYTPGNFVLQGALFRLFGFRLTTIRNAEVVLLSVLWVLFFLTGRRLSRGKWVIPLLAATFAAWWLGALLPHGTAVLPSLVLVLITLSLLLHHDEARPKPTILIAAGLATGVGLMFRQDVAIYAAVPAVVYLTYTHLVRAGSFRIWKPLVFYGLAAGVPPTLTAIWLVGRVSLKQLWQMLIVFPVSVWPKVAKLPFPSLLPTRGESAGPFMEALKLWMNRHAVYYVPLLLLLIALPYICAHVLKDVRDRRPGHGGWSLLVWLTVATWYLYVAVRSDFPHIVPPLAVSALLIPMLIPWLKKAMARGSSLYRLSSISAASIIALLFGACTKLAIEAKVTTLQAQQNGRVILAGPARGLVVDRELAETLTRAIGFFQRNTSESDRIFVTGPRNDRLTLTHVMTYVVVKRRSGTVYNELLAGLTTEAKLQRQIARDLEKNRVEFVVRWPETEQACEPSNFTCTVRGARLLDSYLGSHFMIFEDLGAISILRRTEEPTGISTGRFGP